MHCFILWFCFSIRLTNHGYAAMTRMQCCSNQELWSMLPCLFLNRFFLCVVVDRDLFALLVRQCKIFLLSTKIYLCTSFIIIWLYQYSRGANDVAYSLPSLLIQTELYQIKLKSSIKMKWTVFCLSNWIKLVQWTDFKIE